jgi:hypothetical protein
MHKRAGRLFPKARPWHGTETAGAEMLVANRFLTRDR